MLDVVSRYGYREASVERALKVARVSRATFYENFESKSDCFFATYRGVAQRVVAAAAALAESPEEVESPRTVLARVLAGAEREPAAARAFLLESLAAGPALREERERTIERLEIAVERYLVRLAAEGVGRFVIPPRALLGAIGGVVAMKIFRREGGLRAMLDDLDRWFAGYALPARAPDPEVSWEGLSAAMSFELPVQPNPLERRLPRGRSALPPASVAAEHRQRVLAAVARLAREKGFAATTVADVVSTAGIARESFYDLFRGKEDAFLTAQAYALQSSLSLAASRFFAEALWPERVWDAALPMLGYIASVPDLTTLDFIESYSVGPAAIRRSFEGRMAYTLFLEEGYRLRPEAESLPRLCSEAIAGGLLELMRQRTVAGEIETIPALAPQVVYVALAPFTGPLEALTLVRARLAGAAD